MQQVTCTRCGHSWPFSNSNHVCSKETSIPDNVKKLWADPRFQILADVHKLLNGSRIWGGMEWTYNPIHPVKYLPVAEQVRKALDAVKAEYGVEE